MKTILFVLLLTSAHAQILRESRPSPTPTRPSRGSNYSDVPYRGRNVPDDRPRPNRVRTSPSNWSDPHEGLIKNSLSTPTGIALDTDWKIKLNNFAVKNVSHPSWGYSHSERNYHNTKMIALHAQIDVDEEVLFAAAFLHDLGGLKGFEVEGVDHGLRSAQLAEPLLKEWGFPDQKISQVLEVIIGHIYYGPTPQSDLARAFRDADMLDFLGPMGVARLVAAVSEMGNPATIDHSIASVSQMQTNLPKKFSFEFSRSEGAKRILESKAFLKKLEAYSFNGKAY